MATEKKQAELQETVVSETTCGEKADEKGICRNDEEGICQRSKSDRR